MDHDHSAHATTPDSATTPDATAVWEELYLRQDRIWSGNANRALVEVLDEFGDRLTAGRALDLGSGEGGDSLWLAAQGWRVTGLDISPTAIARAGSHAAERGLGPDAVTFTRADLAVWQPEGEYELVSACFLHSMVEFPREEVLRRAASAVAPGGALLVVGHASFPAWSSAHEHEHDALPSSDEVLAALDLPAGEWRTLLSESRPREVTSPDGEPFVIDDAVLLVQRLG